MLEFYKWAAEDFGNFVVITTVLVVAAMFIIDAWRGKS